MCFCLMLYGEWYISKSSELFKWQCESIEWHSKRQSSEWRHRSIYSKCCLEDHLVLCESTLKQTLCYILSLVFYENLSKNVVDKKVYSMGWLGTI